MYRIREIEKKDDKKIEKVIRDCLIEFGANHEGTAWTDPDLDKFSTIYNVDGFKYYVVVDSSNNVVGGCGVGRLNDLVCELQKMYLIPCARGSGIAHELINIVLEYASEYYNKCYLETLDNMIGAQKFYEKEGFVRTYENIAETEHFACDVKYIKDLK